MNRENEVADNAQPPKVELYPPVLVASIMTAFFLNATEDGRPFPDLKSQLESAIVMADQAGDNASRLYAEKVRVVLDFYKSSETNRDLFENLHFGVKLLLKALTATNRWSVCSLISQRTIRGLISLQRD
jgi:hypothetical protein